MVLAALLFTLVTPGISAQVTHVSNPYVGATVYASPDYVTEVQAAATANPSWASQIAIVGNTPTFFWMDHIGAIYGDAVSQSGANVTVSEQAGQTRQNIPANGSYSGFGFNGTWNGTTNAIPTNFALNGTACTIN
jgi:cellulase/cellobiase CelA1